MWMTKILKFCVENSKITENVMPLRELNILVKICILTRFFLVNLWLTIDFLKTFLKIVFGVFNVHKSLWFYNDYFYILIKIKLVFSFLFFFYLIFFQLVKKSEYYRAGCVYYPTTNIIILRQNYHLFINDILCVVFVLVLKVFLLTVFGWSYFCSVLIMDSGLWN